MKLKTTDLKYALDIVTPSILPKSTLPILESVKLTTDKGKLTVTGGDTEQTLTVFVPATGDLDVCVNARKFKQLIDTLEEQDITVTESNGRLTVKAGGVFNFNCVAGEDYVEQMADDASGEERKMSREELFEAIRHTSYAVSLNSAQTGMQGLCLVFGKSVKAVATNAARLAEYGSEEGEGISIPRRAADIILRSFTDADLKIKISSSSIVISDKTVRFCSRLYGEPFPKYKMLMTQIGNNIATVKREALLNTIKRSLMFSSEVGQLWFSLGSSGVQVISSNPDTGNDAVEVVKCTYKGEALDIGLNGIFMADALTHIDCEEVEIYVAPMYKMGEREIMPAAFIKSKDKKEKVTAMVSPHSIPRPSHIEV